MLNLLAIEFLTLQRGMILSRCFMWKRKIKLLTVFKYMTGVAINVSD